MNPDDFRRAAPIDEMLTELAAEMKDEMPSFSELSSFGQFRI